MADYPAIPTLYDANGHVINSAYAPVTSRPGQALYSSQGGILSLGVDASGNARAPRIDANGNVATLPATATQAGAAVSSASSVVGSVMLALQGLTPTALQMDGAGNVLAAPAQNATFSAIATGVSLARNTSTLAVMNKSSSAVLRLLAVYAQNTATNPSTLNSYYIYAEQLHFITGLSGGTSLTPVAFDTADTLASGIQIATGGTVSGESAQPIRRWITSGYPLSTGGTAAENTTGDEQGRNPWFAHTDPGCKAVVIRPGSGVHLKPATTVANAAQDITFIFSQAAA